MFCTRLKSVQNFMEDIIHHILPYLRAVGTYFSDLQIVSILVSVYIQKYALSLYDEKQKVSPWYSYSAELYESKHTSKLTLCAGYGN